MDWYSIIKLLHVVAAILWLGGGFAMVVLATRADRASDHETLLHHIRSVTLLGARVFVPSSLATLLTGLAMAWLWTGFSEPWILIGIGGFTFTFIMGVAVLGPSATRVLLTAADEGAGPTALRQARRLLQVAKIDLTAMFVVVAAMVLKPSSGDYAVLGAMVAVFAVGAFVCLAGLRASADPALIIRAKARHEHGSGGQARPRTNDPN